MTCEESLSMLATMSLRDMSADSPVMAHCATCPDCYRVTTMLREREYEAASVLNALPPLSHPMTVAESAIGTAKRRKAGGIVVALTGIALAITIAFTAQSTIIPALNRADDIQRLRTETIPLACLSPQQAGDIISPYVRSHGSTYYTPTSGISAITVRATREEMKKARSLIDQFEKDPGAACHVGIGKAAPQPENGPPVDQVPPPPRTP